MDLATLPSVGDRLQTVPVGGAERSEDRSLLESRRDYEARGSTSSPGAVMSCDLLPTTLSPRQNGLQCLIEISVLKREPEAFGFCRNGALS